MLLAPTHVTGQAFDTADDRVTFERQLPVPLAAEGADTGALADDCSAIETGAGDELPADDLHWMGRLFCLASSMITILLITVAVY